jgi:hypothetical protein
MAHPGHQQEGEDLTQTFYRLLDGFEATRQDFLSYLAMNLPLQDDSEETRRLAAGVSVFATVEQARKRARQVRSLRSKRFIAEVRIPDGSAITFERTTRTPEHYTLWGDPVEILGCVVSIHPVEEVDLP